MSKRDKLIAQICKKGQVSIDEIHDLLSYLGFSSRQKGSHVVFTYKHFSISIPAKGEVKKPYLQQLCRILRESGH